MHFLFVFNISVMHYNPLHPAHIIWCLNLQWVTFLLQNVVTKEDFGLIDFLPKLFPLFINPSSAGPEYIQFLNFLIPH